MKHDELYVEKELILQDDPTNEYMKGDRAIVDALIAPAIEELNKRGYRTRYSCAGHPKKREGEKACTYIAFHPEMLRRVRIEFPEGWIVEYDRNSDGEGTLLMRKNLRGKTMQKREAEIRRNNRALLKWAKTLWTPEIDARSKIKE